MEDKKELSTKITVKYGKLKKVVGFLERINPTDDTDISFEYIIGSCFPDIYNNIKKELHIQYTKGYVEGLKERERNDEEKDFKYNS